MAPSQAGFTVPNILDGQDIVYATNVPVYSHNGEPLYYYAPLENPSDKVDSICESSYDGFKKWSGRTSEDRRDILLQAATNIEKNANVYIDAHVALGAPSGFARFGVEGAVAGCREYASQITRPHGLNLQTVGTDLAFTQQTPMGPILAIAAWNAPTILWARAIIAPLAAGCSVVVKSSEKAPLHPYLLVRDLLEAGVDPQAVQLVQAEGDNNRIIVERLLENKRIKKVNFTGSTAVGRQIGMIAAQNHKPVLLELGGKNVAVVMKDADLARAATSVIYSAWLHKGQVCMCVDLVYVHAEVYEEFLKVLKNEALRISSDPDFSLNQRDEVAAKKVHDLVTDAVEKGAEIFFGNSTKEGPSNCSSIILTDVPEEASFTSEESFGPVFSVQKYENIDDVIESVNDQPHGLKASIWSTDIVSAVEIAKNLEFGGVHINSSTVHDEPTIPHGAVKESGSGRFNSVWGLEEFRYTKAITISR